MLVGSYARGASNAWGYVDVILVSPRAPCKRTRRRWAP